MTVGVETNRVVYLGAGITGPFAIPFPFLADGDIKVIKTLVASPFTQTVLVLTTDYTLTGATDPNGGTLTLAVALPATYNLTIYRDPAVTQGIDYLPNDGFPAESHERGLDRLTMIANRFRDILTRAFRLSDGDTSGLDTTLPAPVAGSFVKINAAGTAMEFGLAAGVLAVSAFGQLLLNAATKAAAQLLLGQNRNALWCGNAGGTANAITLTTGANLVALSTGDEFVWKATATNSAATTVAIDTVAAKTSQLDGNAMIGGEILSGKWYRSTYDGANLQTEKLAFSSSAISASPAQITAAQNDYAPPGIASVHTLRVNSDARRAITGLTSGVDGRIIQIFNVGTFPITFKQEDAGSTAANRFAFGHTLSGQHAMRIQYDGTTARWRCAAKEETAGTLKDFAGGTVPEGYLARDGSNINRTTWASLFNEVGTTWGVGDGATTFGVGDDRRRSSIGSGGAGTGTIGNAVGNVGGEEGHPLTGAENGPHTHDAALNNTVIMQPAVVTDVMRSGGSWPTSSSGSGTAHNTYHPSYVVTKIIKV